MGLFDTLGRNIATAGNALHLPELGISELFSGSQSQNQPYYSFNPPSQNQASSGQTLGVSNTQSNTPYGPANPGFQYQNPAGPSPSTGGSNLFSTPQNNQQPQNNAPQNNFANQQLNSINQGWDSYTNQLNDMLNNNLPGQKTAQEQIANNNYQSGVSQLGDQKAQSEQALSKQQNSSLKDLSSNIQNLFTSGNTFLGARGAADSSAANQYSYAISKMGTKARGDIMTQASDRLNQIGDTYKSEVNRLETEKNNQISNIANWFSQAQGAIKQQIGQAGLGRQQDIQGLSQNIYNQALQAMQNVQSQIANQRSQLETWALNNSKSTQEVIQNFQNISQLPQFQGIQGGMPSVTPEGQSYLPTGYGANTSQKKDLFGNVIQ